ncbi:MAG: hypothetical protein ABEJ73_04500 [Haloplanus sp.]
MTDDETGAAADATADDDTSRRRLLALFGSAVLTLLGAGAGVSNFFGAGDGDRGEGGLDLSIDYSVTPDGTTPTPTPTSDGTAGDGADDSAPPSNPDTDTGAPDTSDGTAPSTADESRGVDEDDDERSAPPRRHTPTDESTRSGDLATSSIPPVSLTDLVPGEGGVVDLSLTLSGSPARLYVRGDATDFAENGIVEVERSAGDTESPGELQEHVQVRLWYDADGDGAEPRSAESRSQSSDRVLYEGTLDGLGALSEWLPLTEACVSPGTHTVRLRWDVPADAPNTVQTDEASFSLGVAADASACQ